MQSRKNLTLKIAGAVALAMMVGTSAFAESRHHEGTSRGSSGHVDRGTSSRSNGSSQSRDRSVTQSPQRFESRGNIQRYETRGGEARGNETRGNESRGTVQQDQYRGNNQRSWDRGNAERGTVARENGNWRGNASRGAVAGNVRGAVVLPRGVEHDRFHYVPGFRGGVAPYRAHEAVRSFGRVDRFERFHGGYRVWLGGGLYPIFVPFDRWALFPLRVGLFIRFGGYWDPFGYWSVYDYAPYYGDGYGYADGPYYDGGGYTSGVVHGLVESIDFRRGTMVVNDDISRQFVTVEMPRDRRLNDIRPGDYVEFSGDWNRRGVFNAYRLERIGDGRDGYDNRYDNRDDGRY